MTDRAYRVFARLAASASATRPEDLAAFTVVRHGHEESLTLDGQPLHCHGVIPVADADEVAYDQILHDTARGALDGEHVAVITVGAPRTGKSWTVIGGDKYEQRGLVPRVLSDIFETAAEDDQQVSLECCCLVVRDQIAYDLLDRDLAIKPMSEWQAVELSDIPSYRARSEDEALSIFSLLKTNKDLVELAPSADSEDVPVDMLLRVLVRVGDAPRATRLVFIDFSGQSRLDDEDASLSSPKAADGKQHTLKGFAQNRSMAVLERVLLRLETAKAPALLPVSLAEQLALSFLWSDPDDPAADPLSLSPRYRPVLARLPLHLVFTLSVNKTDLPESLETLAVATQAVHRLNALVPEELRLTEGAGKLGKSPRKDDSSTLKASSSKDSTVIASTVASVKAAAPAALVTSGLTPVDSSDKLADRLAAAKASDDAAAAAVAASDSKLFLVPSKSRSAAGLVELADDDLDVEQDTQRVLITNGASWGNALRNSQSTDSVRSSYVINTSAPTTSVVTGAAAVGVLSANTATAAGASTPLTHSTSVDRKSASGDAQPVAASAVPASGPNVHSRSGSRVGLLVSKSARLSGAAKSKIAAVVDYFLQDDEEDCVLPVDLNDNAQLGEAFSILKDKVSRTSDLTTMCSTLSDQLSTLRDRLEERNRTLAAHEAQLKAAEERAHQLEAKLQDKLQVDEKEREEFQRMLSAGVEVLKHGRRGKPHTRKFTYIDGRLCWNNGKKSFHMREVVGVVEGRRTPVLQKVDASVDNLCFAVMTPIYTLNLQAKSAESRRFWLNGLRLLIAAASQGRV